MKVYAWDESGLLIDINGRELREDVLNGGFLPHAENETTDVPPALLARQTARYVNGSWSVIPDNRGVTYYDTSTREPHTITEAGVEPESGWTDKEPPMKPYYEFSESEGDWIVSLPLLRDFQKQQIHAACEAEMKTRNQGYVSPTIGVRIDCRENDVIRLDQFIDLTISKGGNDATVVQYICYDNSKVPVTLADVKTAKYEISEQITDMLYQKHTVYGQIDAAQTEETIKAVAWVWPV